MIDIHHGHFIYRTNIRSCGHILEVTNIVDKLPFFLKVPLFFPCLGCKIHICSWQIGGILMIWGIQDIFGFLLQWMVQLMNHWMMILNFPFGWGCPYIGTKDGNFLMDGNLLFQHDSEENGKREKSNSAIIFFVFLKFENYVSKTGYLKQDENYYGLDSDYCLIPWKRKVCLAVIMRWWVKKNFNILEPGLKVK